MTGHRLFTAATGAGALINFGVTIGKTKAADIIARNS